MPVLIYGKHGVLRLRRMIRERIILLRSG